MDTDLEKLISEQEQFWAETDVVLVSEEEAVSLPSSSSSSSLVSSGSSKQPVVLGSMTSCEEEICKLWMTSRDVDTIAGMLRILPSAVQKTLIERSSQYKMMVEVGAARRRWDKVDSFHSLRKRVFDRVSLLVDSGELSSKELILLLMRLDEVDPDRVLVRLSRSESVHADIRFNLGDATDRAKELGFVK